MAPGRCYLPIRSIPEDSCWCRYLLEIQSFPDCEKTVRKAEANCADKESIAYAYLCCNFVSLYERTGRSPKAIDFAHRSPTIHEPISIGINKNDLANAYSDVGYASISHYDAQHGIEYCGKAVAIANAGADTEPEFYRTYNIDRFLRNRGRGKMMLGSLDEAVKDFDDAQRYQV
jgi:tetratricopeptide (TPR) repeat protein